MSSSVMAKCGIREMMVLMLFNVVDILCPLVLMKCTGILLALGTKFGRISCFARLMWSNDISLMRKKRCTICHWVICSTYISCQWFELLFRLEFAANPVMWVFRWKQHRLHWERCYHRLGWWILTTKCWSPPQPKRPPLSTSTSSIVSFPLIKLSRLNVGEFSSWLIITSRPWKLLYFPELSEKS